MRAALTLAVLAAAAAIPAHAGRTNLETGETCFGIDCFEGGVALPETPPPQPETAATEAASLCETVASRIYQLCTRNENASGADCVAERARALARCENPPDHAGTTAPAGPRLGPTSSGVYRIPYADGIEVKINHDYFRHTPPGRLDMHAKGGNGQAVVAAAAGVVRLIEDGRSKKQHPWDSLRKGPCMNNFVWIEHDNGEWSKYSHLRQGSTTGKAGLAVGDRVAEGAYLGDEGAVGCASSSHLHWEVAVPGIAADKPFDPADPFVYFDPLSGGLKANAESNRNRNPRICGIETATFRDGGSYTAVAGPGEVAPGQAEVVRHGMPIRNYLCFVRRGVLAGYQTAWLDFFEIDGELFVNAIMRPKTRAWASRSGLDAEGFLAENAALRARGYRLSLIETYRDGGVRYAGIWEERGSPAQQLTIGRTAAEHQAEVDRLMALGYRPRAVSVVEDGGLKYSALWEQVPGGWKLRSALTLAEYRSLADDFAADGFRVAAVNAYATGDGPRVAAIWLPGGGAVWLPTSLGKAEFTDERAAALDFGLGTVAVTGHEAGGFGRYTGVFHR